MKMSRILFSFAVLFVTAASLVQAQATRTWVSGVGDDVNPCSRTAPCKTFAGAIVKTAAGGEIDALDPGGYGAVTITKAITIDGGGGQVASVLVSGTNGILVAAGVNDFVTLRNLRIQGIAQSGSGGLNGIQFNSGAALHIESCNISGFTLNGINIVGSTGGQVFIVDSVSQDNVGNGVEVEATVKLMKVSISNSHFPNNNNGVYAGSFSRMTVMNSDTNGNSVSGFVANATVGTTDLNIVFSAAANNKGAGLTAGGAGAASVVRMSNASLVDNAAGLSVLTGGKVDSFGNNANPNGGVPTLKFTLQ